MKEPQTQQLHTLCELIVDCPHSTPKWTESGYVVLRNQNIRGGRLDLSSPSFTDEEHYNYRIKRGVPSTGDLVLTREAPMGEVCAIPEGLECCLGQRMVLIRPTTSKLDSQYLLYALQGRALQHQIGWNKGTGTTVSNLRIPVLKALEVPVLPLDEQKIISAKLKALDDKIALNRRQNETLEAMAQALFKSWFVDFDPVIDNALEAGHDIPEPLRARAKRRRAVLAGGQYPRLDAEVRGLFPDRFVWQEALGKWCPAGWEEVTLEEFVVQTKRSAIPAEIESNTPYIGLQQMPRNSIALSAWKTGEEVESNKYRFSKGDILFGKLRPYFHKVGVAPTDGVCSTDILVLQPAKSHFRGVAISLMSSKDVVDYATSSATGTRMPRASWKYLCKYPIPKYPDTLCQYFSNHIAPALGKIQANVYQSTNLASLRDLLLGELIG